MTSKDFERYTPQHPLPQELQKLGRDDTVCQFCGVSYLIHNEIKALEEKLKWTENQLEIYKRSFEKVGELESEVASLKKEIADHELFRQTAEERVTSANLSREKMKNELDDARSLVKSMKENSVHVEQDLAKYRNRSTQIGAVLINRIKPNLVNLHDQCSQMKKDIIDLETTTKEDMRVFLRNSVETVTMTVRKYENAFNSMKRNYEDKIQHQKTTLDEITSAKEETEEQLIFLRDDLRNTRETLSSGSSELVEIRRKLNEEVSKSRGLSMEIDQYKDMLNRKAKEHETWQQSLKKREQNTEDRLKLVESELLQCKFDLDDSRRICNQYRSECDQFRSMEAEIIQKQNSSYSELASIKSTLNETQEHLSQLKTEREKMILAHQTRMEQLKENYRTKLNEASGWSEKIGETLKAEKNKHLAELANLESRLTESFNIELEIERQKNSEMLEKLREEASYSNEAEWRAKLAASESRYSSAVSQLKNITSSHGEEMRSMNKAHEIQVEDLQGMIIDLRNKLHMKPEYDPAEMLNIKQELVHERQEVEKYKQTSQSLEQKMDCMREEIVNLQETVRRECEERFELTERLSTMKQELMTLQKPPQGYVSSRQPSIPPQFPSASALVSAVEEKTFRRGSIGSLGTLQTNTNASTLSLGRRSNSGGSSDSGPNLTSLPSGSMMSAAGSQRGSTVVATKRRLAALMASQRQQKT